MKGLFIPDITAEMFRSGCLESIEALMAKGEIYDIDYEPEQRWIPVTERLPEVGAYVLISKKELGFRSNLPNVCTAHRSCDPRSGKEEWNDMLFGKLDDDDVLAWMPLPDCYQGGGEAE